MTFDVSSRDRNSNGDDTSIRVDGSMGGTTAPNHTNDIGAGIHNDDDDDDDIISIMKNNSNSNSNSNNNNRNDDDDNDNDDATIAARSLIARLQGDFRAEGKRTCRDCLRSKTLPCSRVTEVANELVAAAAGTGGSTLPLPLVLERAHSILLREHATVLPPNSGSGSGSDPPSALVCMNRIAAVLRFVQLLLWLSSRKGDDDDYLDHHRSKNPTRALLLPAAETNAAMASLLQALTHGICDLLGSSNSSSSSSSTPTPNVIVDVDVDADDHGPDCPSDPLLADATKSLLPGPVFCYAFFSLLRMNEYVRTRGALVVPLWKGLCDLAETLVAAAVVPEGASDHPDENENENENNDDDKDEDNDDREDETHDWRNHLPPNLLGDAIRILGEFLREGKERLEVGAVTNCWNGCASEGKDGIHTHNTIAFQGRFVGFLVARMTHLLGVYFSLRGGDSGSSGSSDDDATTTHDDDDDDEGEPRDPPVTNEVWRSLLGLRGMATALQVLHSSSEANTAVVVGVGVGGIDRSFLKVYCEIAAKAGKCITGMVVPPSPRPKSNSYSDPRTRQIRTRTRTRALESLLQSTMARKGNDDDDDDDNDTGDDSFHYRDRKDAHVRSKAIRLSDLGNTTGKVLVLQQVLQRMATAETAAGGFFSAESLLVTIEAIHSVAVPDCLAACIVAVRGERGVDPTAAVDADPSNIATTAITTTLPTTIVDGSLRIMVRALKAVATSDEFASRTVEVESEAESKRDALHRLLVRWLAGSSSGGGTNPGDGATHPYPYPYPHHHQHPLAREMVVSLLHAHILGSATATTTGREIGHSTKKLLSLLTKLCVDARTHWLLRSNIGALLIRLQQSKSPGTTGASVSASASSVAVSELARQIVEKEFVARLSRDATQSRECKQRKRKRKRTRSRKDDTTVEQLDPEDVRVVSRVLGSGRALSESLGSSLNNHNHNHNHNDDDNNDQHRILRGEFSWLSSGLGVSGGLADSEEALLAVAGRISLLLAWLERIIATTTTGSGSPLQRFRGTTGLDLVVDIVKPAVAAIASLTFRPGGVDSAKVLRRKVLLYCAALRLCATAATVFGNNDDGNELPLERVGLLIKHALSKEALQNERGNGGNGSTIDIDPLLVRGQQSILKFEVLNLLGCIGNTIPSACSERVLRTIRRAFASCLSSGDWAVASVGISSLVSFGSQLHPAHQRILPQCLARASTGFFQARASDRLWKGKHCDSSTAKEESVWELVDGMAHRLYPCSHGCGHEHKRRLTVRSVLPSATTTSTIAPGSYIMEMPTQGDRSAMVVFPPGPQSLEDIRYMLGMDVGDENDNDNDENATVPAQRLKRAIATSRGGLKLLLLPLRKPS